MGSGTDCASLFGLFSFGCSFAAGASAGLASGVFLTSLFAFCCCYAMFLLTCCCCCIPGCICIMYGFIIMACMLSMFCCCCIICCWFICPLVAAFLSAPLGPYSICCGIIGIYHIEGFIICICYI